MNLIKKWEGKEAAKAYKKFIQPELPIDVIERMVEDVEYFEMTSAPGFGCFFTGFKDAEEESDAA